MKTKRILTACICAVMAISAFPRQYNPQVLFNLKGPVKKRVIETQDSLALLSKSIDFTKDGALTKDMLTYNDEGYPIGYGMNFGKMDITVDVDYNSLQLPAKLIFKATYPRDVNLEIVYDYDGSRLKSRHVKSKDGSTCDFIYSDEKYDSRNNWISRKVKETSHDTRTGKTETKEYTETQTISYY